MPKHRREASDLVLKRDSLSDQLLSRNDQRPDSVGCQRLHMDPLEEASAGKLRQPSRIVAVGLVRRQRLQRLMRLPALDADHRHSQCIEAMVEHWRHAARLEHNPLTAWRLPQRPTIASGKLATFVSSMTPPSRSTTQMCVSFIEISNPAKHSMTALLFRMGSDRIGLREEQPSHYPMLKNSNQRSVPRSLVKQ